MSKRFRKIQEPDLFARDSNVKAQRERFDRDNINAYGFFDAAYPSPENLQNWGHLQPETIEDIFDPDTLRKLQMASICEVLNDDALNGMVAVGAESIIGRGCKVQVQIGLKHNKYNELEQYIEYLWDSWFKSVRYGRLLRTAQKDQMVLGSYFRRITQNPYKKFGMDVMLVSPLRIQTPYNMQEGDFIVLDGEHCRVYNGIAFDEYRNRRFYCVSDRPPFANGYYDDAVFEWVSARHMCHVFNPQFSEQITGYPMVAPSLEKGIMRRQYEKEELKAARLGASITGTVETTSDFRAILEHLKPNDLQTLFMMAFKDWERAGETFAVHSNDILNMPPHSTIKPFDTKHPHLSFKEFRQELLKGQGRSLCMPEGFALGTYANYSYAAAMKDAQNWHQHRDCCRQDIELTDLQQLFDTFVMTASALDGKLAPLLDRWGRFAEPIIPTFYWKEEEHADPVKQMEAWAIGINQRVLTRSDVMMRLGFDPEKQKREVKAEWSEMEDCLPAEKTMTLKRRKEGNDD